MALIKGKLISYEDLLLSVVPTIVEFQYNPAEISRVFTFSAERSGSQPTGAALSLADPPQEAYSVKLEIDATDGLEKGAPITMISGIAPQLAAIEMLAQPIGSSGLTSFMSQGASVPVSRLPFVLFVWGPFRITPVRVRSLSIRETAFDERLNPIQATVDLGFTVLREADVSDCGAMAKAAASYYHRLRRIGAVVQLGQLHELAEP